VKVTTTKKKPLFKKVGAMVTSTLMDKDLLLNIKLFADKLKEKDTKFGGFSMLTEKVVNIRRPCGQNPPPRLNGVYGAALLRLSITRELEIQKPKNDCVLFLPLIIITTIGP